MSDADAPAASAVAADAHARRIHQILDTVGDGFCAFDRDWRFSYCNPTAEQHLGFAPGKAVGQVMWEAIPMTLGSPLEPILRAAMVERRPQAAEVASVARPGVILELRAFPIDDGIGVSFHDITERRARDARERAQAQRLELALSASGLGDWSWDAANDLVTLSEQAAAIFGIPPGPRMTWTEILTLIHPDDAQSVSRAVEAAITDGTPYEAHYRVRPPGRDDEVWVMSRARPAHAEDGRTTGLLGVVGDITRSKVQEARLRESEARFRAMADSAPAPVWVTSAAGTIEFVNQAFVDFAGQSAEALLGDAWLDLLHPDDAPALGHRRAKGRTGPDAYWVEARFRHHSGAWRWMRASSKPRFDAAGRFQGYVGLAVDMTEVRAAEARQQLLINELNHRVKNTLATVQSIARQTLKEGVVSRAARGQLTERLMALSAAHNVLTRENWESAELRDIALEALRPYDDTDVPRITMAGPAARLAPNVALALSMGLHELATNATKHGALSVPRGRVDIAWTRADDPGAIRLVWREAGGPPVTAPADMGFGSRLLAQGLAAELGHPARLDYAPEGLICTIVAPRA